jgi:hypothetical protein
MADEPEQGVRLIHVVIDHDVAKPESLQQITAFQAFVADVESAATCLV